MTFDPGAFAFSAPLDVDRFAKEIVVSPSSARCYVGDRGLRNFTEVVSVRSGRMMTLPFAPPSAIVDAEKNLEIWIHPQERRVRRVRFHEDDTVESVHDVDAPTIEGLEHFYAFGKHLYALGLDRTKDPFPLPGADKDRRDLVRLSCGSDGIAVDARQRTTHYYDLLGREASGRIVALGVPGKTHVLLLDGTTLIVLASRAFPKNGMYRIAALASPTSVFAFRRWERIDRAFCARWSGERPSLRIADAKVVDEPS